MSKIENILEKNKGVCINNKAHIRNTHIKYNIDLKVTRVGTTYTISSHNHHRNKISKTVFQSSSGCSFLIILIFTEMKTINVLY